MRKVIITRGAYGHKPVGALHVTPKSRYDGPFEVEDKEAERIVGLGIAKYVDEEVATPPAPPLEDDPGDPNGDDDDPPEGTGDGDPEEDEQRPEYGESSSVAELREIGKGIGLTFAVGTTKAQMIAALDEYFSAGHDSEPTDDEPPPTLNAEVPEA